MATKNKKMILDSDSDSDDETELKINKNYAARYDTWRQKEELQKLKDRYGDETSDSDSSSSSEDLEVDPEVEKEFLKTLSSLKEKDPKIYDKKISFFKENESETKKEDKLKKKKEKPIYIKDHEREMLLSKNGKLSDIDEDENAEENRKIKINFQNVSAKEVAELKESFKNIPTEDEEDDLFTIRNKTKQEKEKEEADFIEWLKGNQSDVADNETKTEMKYLHDYWNDPKLNQDEKFLKDYILNKKYLDKDDEDRIPSYDEIVHDSDGLSEDELTLDTQDTFEYKYNFRFEEPDQDFIKRYPRTMTDLFRRQDDKRKKKRAEHREKKLEVKERKKDELMQLKALKRKEIMDKLDKLEKITGNVNSAFDKDFLKSEFDPDEHEKIMGQIFDDEYYGECDETKPEFETDEEIDGDNINWDEYEDYHEPHCEDPDFNMDADYQPEIIDESRGKGKKKNKLAQLLETKKPIFNEKEKTFEEYIDEYYKLDYEDLIGDLPCRFKYRETLANNFGLTYEEILKADDKELNKWSSLKKTVKYRSEKEEKFDLQAYKKKSKDLNKKKRILTTVFNESEKEDEIAEASTSSKRRKYETKEKFNAKKDKMSDERLRAYGLNPKKYNNKLKYGNKI